MSLSKTYRPQVFQDVTGQEQITETLRKEVETDKIAHAYLFSGPRGVGKTTCARILAKALNCTSPKNGEPCNACSSCTEANEGRLIDIIEMDAASHTGVDNVREAIVEHVRFAPVSGKRKVYIIDETHMLSTSAFNALLKTLEEPPSYAVFILATTELHKVPATIVSRCQRFEFRRVTDEALRERLAWIAKQEKVSVDPAVIATVARRADGSVRDAETLFGQLLALGESKITSDVAELVIPASRLPIAAEILDVCAGRVLGPALQTVASLDERGVPFVPLFDDLIMAVRQLLISAEDAGAAKRLQDGDEGEKRLAALVGQFTPAELAEMSLLLMERRRDAKQGIDPRFAMELTVTAIALGCLPHGPGQGIGAGPGAALRTVASVTPEAVARPAPSVAAAPPEKKSSGPSAFSLTDVRTVWRRALTKVAETSTSMSTILTTATPEHAEGNIVTIRFQYAYHRDRILNEPKTRRMLEDALASLLNVETVRAEGVVGEDPVRTEQRSRDMVSSVLKAFGGEVVDGTAA